MVNLYGMILRSVPVDVMRDQNGPLSADEIPEAAAYMDRLGEQVKAARESGESG